MPTTHRQEDVVDGKPAEWSSGFFKQAVGAPVWLGETNLDGDGQADLNAHGGPHKAVNVYPSEHFPHWQAVFGGAPVGAGGFGENFTTQGLLEGEVCIGDIFQIGQVQVQISQPRQPCWKLARRWRMPALAKQVRSSGRTGWYFRTLQTGSVRAGDAIVLLQRSFPQWTVAAANAVMQNPGAERQAVADLADCAALTPSWRERLKARIAPKQ